MSSSLPGTPTPTDVRPVGAPPFAAPGSVVHWTYRGAGWVHGAPQHVNPMRVVRDDERGLVAWLAEGTVLLQPRYPDGGTFRERPLSERFFPSTQRDRISARARWRGPGILRIAPTDRPFSVWLFWSTQGQFAGWYANLENPLLRAGDRCFTSDHVLDVWITADGQVRWKDEDELAEAVAQGRYTEAQAQALRTHGEQAIDEFRSGAWMFDARWTSWRAPADWTVPHLPDDAHWQLDLLDCGGRGSPG